MLYHLLYPLHTEISVFNVFRYITFRSAYAMVTALLISFLLGPAFIRMLRRIQMFQVIREEGPKTHQAKQGTPTMGGVLILTAVLVPSLLWCNLTNRYVQIALISTVWTGAIGFLDAYLRVVKRRPKGLVGRHKLVGQMALGLGLGAYLYFNPLAQGAGTLTSIPFAKGLFINSGPLFILLVCVCRSVIRVRAPRLLRLSEHHVSRGQRRAGRVLHVGGGRRARISLVQRASRAGVHGRYRLALARGHAGCGGRAAQARAPARHHRRAVRGRSAERDDPGDVVQADAPARVQNGPAAPSLRALGMARKQGRGPFLDRGRSARAPQFEHAQTAIE